MSTSRDKRVCLYSCEEYDSEEIEKRIEDAFVNLDFEGRIKEGMKVLIKPNLLLGKSPDEGVCTHPAVIEAVCRAVIRRKAQALIADSPGGPYTPPLLDGVYRVSGLMEAAKKTGAALNFDTSFGSVENTQKGSINNFSFITPLLQADLVISVCKLKTHSMLTFTGGVKNMFGVVPGLIKPRYHLRAPSKGIFAGIIVDICETASPDLTIMDGIVGMEGDGPSGGQTRKIGALLVSQNPHALDYVATLLVGFDHKLIPTLVAARKKGIFDYEKDRVEVIGDSIENRKVKDFLMPGSQSAMFSSILPDWAGKIVGQFFMPKPVVDESKCIGCGACERICPAHAAKLTGRHAVIDRSRCIKCYCCHEVCPPKAIILKSKLKFWK